jgi:hypothetical protein
VKSPLWRAVELQRDEFASHDFTAKDACNWHIVVGERTSVGVMGSRCSHDLVEVDPGARATDHPRRGIAEDDPAIPVDDRHRDGKLVQQVRHTIFIEPTTCEARTIDPSMSPLHYASPAPGARRPNKTLRPRQRLSHLIAMQ